MTQPTEMEMRMAKLSLGINPDDRSSAERTMSTDEKILRVAQALHNYGQERADKIVKAVERQNPSQKDGVSKDCIHYDCWMAQYRHDLKAARANQLATCLIQLAERGEVKL